MEQLQAENQQLGDRILELEAEVSRLTKQARLQDEQLHDRIQELEIKNSQLRQEQQELVAVVEQLPVTATIPPAWNLEQLQKLRSNVLKTLTSGKGKVATTSPQYKTAAKVLDRFINELQKSTPVSTPGKAND